MKIITGIKSNGKKVATTISDSGGILVQDGNSYNSIDIIGEKDEIFIENSNGINGNPLIGISDTPYLEYIFLNEIQKIKKNNFTDIKFNKKIEDVKTRYDKNGFATIVDGIYRIDLFFKTDIFSGKIDDYIKIYIAKSEKNGVFQEYNSLSYFDIIKVNSKTSCFTNSVNRTMRLNKEEAFKIYIKSNRELFFNGNDYTEPPLRINLIKIGK